LVGPSVSARWKVMTQTERDTLVLQVGVGRGAKQKPINIFSVEIFLRIRIKSNCNIRRIRKRIK